MGRIELLLVKPINHVLGASPWAKERLRTHSGAHVGFAAGPLNCVMQIDGHGLLQAADRDGTDVLIQFPDDFLLTALVDRNRLMSSARISGAADVAETLAFVFRNLRWDIESDLASILGDIPARRLSLAGAAFLTSTQASGKRAMENLREYVAEESGLLPPSSAVIEFAGEVDRLRDDIARLEKRLQRLES